MDEVSLFIIVRIRRRTVGVMSRIHQTLLPAPTVLRSAVASEDQSGRTAQLSVYVSVCVSDKLSELFYLQTLQSTQLMSSMFTKQKLILFA